MRLVFADLQEYAALKMYNALQSPKIHESGVKVGGYILGEFGHAISDDSISAALLFKTLYAHFGTASYDTRSILLSAFVKMANTFSELKATVLHVFDECESSMDAELQQRVRSIYIYMLMYTDACLGDCPTMDNGQWTMVISLTWSMFFVVGCGIPRAIERRK